MALRNAPTKFDAAVAIDDRLGLKEKFSTALAFAGSDDPFAGLAVADAGRAAGKGRFAQEVPAVVAQALLRRAGVGVAHPPDAVARAVD